MKIPHATHAYARRGAPHGPHPDAAAEIAKDVLALVD
jgi:hypothetical protein